MSAPATIPVTIDPEAAAYVAELGMQAELEQMIEHTRRTLADLTRIKVEIQPNYGTDDVPVVDIQAFQKPTDVPEEESDWWQWQRWKTSSFPPDVFRRFTITIYLEGDHAG